MSYQCKRPNCKNKKSGGWCSFKDFEPKNEKKCGKFRSKSKK